MVAGPGRVYGEADLVLKVKEPQPEESPRLRRGLIVFTYSYFAADRPLTEAVLKSGCIAVAYETLRDDRGLLPLLTPMSEVAGRMSIQEGAKYLERPQMGRGILLGGVSGVAPAHIVILGGGVVGSNAAKVAARFRANVAILDIDMDRLRYLDDIMPGAVGRTSTFALCKVTLPWALRIANRGMVRAAEDFPPVARAVNLFHGAVTNKAVAATFDLPYDPRLER